MMVEPIELKDILEELNLEYCFELLACVNNDHFKYSDLPVQFQRFHQAKLWRCLMERIEKGDITIIY